MYHHLCPQQQEQQIYKWLWKSSCRLRHKIFFWLLLHDRVNTRNLLKRKSFTLESYNCVFCHEDTEETARHLFWDCGFVQDCWLSIIPQKRLGISCLDDILLIRELLPKHIAMEIIIQGCWAIWGQRNGKIFRREGPSINCRKFKLKEDLKLLEHRIKAKYLTSLQGWISDHLE